MRLLLVLLCVFSQTTRLGFTQELHTFRDPNGGFEISYGNTFELMPPSSSEVALVLRSRETGYPTFNVIREPCSPALLERSASEQAERLASEYRHVGLTDTRILDSALRKVQGRSAFTATLEYNSQNKVFVSQVTRILLPSYCLVSTFIDERDNFEKNRFLKSQLDDGLKLIETAWPEAPADTNQAGGRFSYFLSGLVVFFIAFCLLRRRRKIPS